MVKIIIDKKQYEVKPGKNLLETCLSIGIDIPHFCFHPALGSVGACRLCAVKKFRDKDDTRGRIVMSCMEPVTEGLIVSVEDPEAIAFRAAVIEGLMINHPHDCPVCDEGGECHLQDMTIMTGHNYRHYDFPKRTFNNQELGPFISHEMNRCIQCYRCVRFYREYAGGKDLNVFGSRNHVYFGRYEDGTLENEFSGNLIEVCPTGVFTDKTLRKHFTRKWDLSNAPSVCVHCSLGCNTIASERYGSLRRIMNRYNGSVNGYFICDRGRFGYEFVNDENRIKAVMLRSSKNVNPAPVEFEMVSTSLVRSFSKGKKVIGIGSPRASLESNFALMSLVGRENFYHGVSEREYNLTRKISDFLQKSGILSPSLKQIEKADAFLVLGEDLTNTAPMMALALRQGVRNRNYEEADLKGIPLWNDAPLRELAQNVRSPFFIATATCDSLDDLSENTFHGSFGDIAELGFTIAHMLDSKAPDPKSMNSRIKKLAETISVSLKNARNPVIISGISCRDETIVNSALNIATSLKEGGSDVMLSMILPECNSLGLSMLPGKSFEDRLVANASDEIDCLVIVENDLFRHADEASVNKLFGRCRQVIVIDHLLNKSALNADLLLPAATFAESEGTLVNNEGRAQRYYKAIGNKSQFKESWRWIAQLIQLTDPGQKVEWNKFDDVAESLTNEISLFSKLKIYMPDADSRQLDSKIPRQTIRYSGRTAMNADIAVSEPGLTQDKDSPLAFSMEGLQENPPSSLVPFYWNPGWNSVQALYGYLTEPGAAMKGGDAGVRLIEPSTESGANYYEREIRSTKLDDSELMIIPVYSIFGSDELSSVSSSILKRIPDPFVLMNSADAALHKMNDGEVVQLECLKIRIKVFVRIAKSIQQGSAGLSVYLPGLPFIDFPVIGRLHKI
jgi:NADH-quinone oxidoreductase subunit G